MPQNQSAEKNVHVIHPEQGNPLSSIGPMETGYGLLGKEVDASSVQCVAKKVEGQFSTTYFIKKANSGADAGRMYSHHSENHMPGQNPLKPTADGRSRYEFRKVTQNAFDYYLAYLRSDNPAFLRIAERDI